MPNPSEYEGVQYLDFGGSPESHLPVCQSYQATPRFIISSRQWLRVTMKAVRRGDWVSQRLLTIGGSDETQIKEICAFYELTSPVARDVAVQLGDHKGQEVATSGVSHFRALRFSA